MQIFNDWHGHDLPFSGLRMLQDDAVFLMSLSRVFRAGEALHNSSRTVSNQQRFVLKGWQVGELNKKEHFHIARNMKL